MAAMARRAPKIDLAQFTQGKRFTDGEHQILARRNGSKILMTFRRNKPTDVTYVSPTSERVSVSLRNATERQGPVPRSRDICVFTAHQETPGSECVMTTPFFHGSLTLFGEKYSGALFCLVEDCDKYEDWF